MALVVIATSAKPKKLPHRGNFEGNRTPVLSVGCVVRRRWRSTPIKPCIFALRAKIRLATRSLASAKKKKDTHKGCPFLFLVEAARVELASENHLIQLSPSAADLLRFPSRIADRQAMRYGSHYGVTSGVAPCRSRSPLIDASLPTAVLRGKTGGLIRLPTQRYCCRLLFKSAGFIAGPPPLLAYRISQSPSKPLRPHIWDRPKMHLHQIRGRASWPILCLH